MPLSPTELRTTYFYLWEQYMRGWILYEEEVDLEPPFIPFAANQARLPSDADDGQSPGLIGSIVQTGKKLFSSKKEEDPEPTLLEFEAYVGRSPKLYLDEHEVAEIAVEIPLDKPLPLEIMEQFLVMVASKEPIGLDIIGTGDSIVIQWTCRGKSKLWFLQQIKAYFPQAILTDQPYRHLYNSWPWSEESPPALVDFGLSEEGMLPLAMESKHNPDPLTGIIGALEQVRHGEIGVLQIIFQETKAPWSGHIMRSVGDGSGGSFFADMPDLPKITQTKIAHPLFAVVIRIAAQGKDKDRTRTIAEGLIRSITAATRSPYNSLIPLSNVGYPITRHIVCLFERTSQRTGMLLNSRELVTLFHPPSPSIVSAKLNKHTKKTKEAPTTVRGHECVIGINSHFGSSTEVSLSTEQRLRHMHIIGATGTGKSTLLMRMLKDDIDTGKGVLLLDPHGDLTESVITHVPPHRYSDVVVVDPSDSEFPVGFNLLSAHSEVEKIVLSSDLVDMFRRFSTSWGDQMNSILANAIHAFLESSTGGTLIDLRRFLVEAPFRNEFLKNVDDDGVLYFWHYEYPLLRKNAVAPLVTRLDMFLRPKLIRNMMAQKKGLDFGALMEQQKIVLVKLSQGLIGRENSYLLGTLIVAKIHQAAQARQSISKHERSPFYVYIDEFQNFITSSMEEILSGARKYGLGLILAHQGLQQLFKHDEYVGNAVIANAGTRVCFRLGDQDAQKLEKGFSYFDASDLQSLGVGEAIVRPQRAELDFTLQTHMLEEIEPEIAVERTRQIIALSRSTHAKTRAEIEELLRQMRPNKFKRKLEESSPIPEKVEPTVEPEFPPPPTFEAQSPTRDLQTQAQEFVKEEKEKKEQREHVYLQTLIKKMAEARGFKAIIEEPTPDKQGRIDVGLTRDDLLIAFEVSVTTPPHYEVQNIQKCLKAGYNPVISTSPRPKHLLNIQSLAESKLSKEEFTKVLFMHSEKVVTYLDSLIIQEPQPEKRIRGYRVKVNYDSISSSEQALKQESIASAVLDAMKKK